MLRGNGIYTKILLKFNFTCQDDIFMLQKYFINFDKYESIGKKIEITKKRLSNDLKKSIQKNQVCARKTTCAPSLANRPPKVGWT
jgi:hypothetical protein